jgi:hypothetical protein
MRNSLHKRLKKRLTADFKEDNSDPITILSTFYDIPESLQAADDTYNSFLLGEREAHGRRTKLRIDVSVYGRQRNGRMGFIRMRNQHVLVSCPTGRQANATIRMMQQILNQLEGKFLAEPTE